MSEQLLGGRRGFIRVADLAKLYTLAPEGWRSTPIQITHCVNPFRAKVGSEHELAQNVTIASMQSARRAAVIEDPALSVRHVAAVLRGEEPENGIFDEVLILQRSILDLHEFRVKRPLPLIYDIIEAPRLSDEDILIYTNIDIGLVSNFYAFVADLFRLGLDAVIINRRTVSDVYTGPEALRLIAAEAGAQHPGYDCFAFRAHLRRKFFLWHSCLGIGGVMTPLVYNMLAFAKAPCVLLDAHVTFHLGDDKTWERPEFHDYAEFNRREIDQVFEKLCDDPIRRENLISALENHPSGRGSLPQRLRSKAGLGRRPPPPIRQRLIKMLKKYLDY